MSKFIAKIRRSWKPHHRCQFRDISLYFIGTSLQMPPLRGWVPLVLTLLHRCRPYGTKEGFWHVKVYR